MSRCTHLGLAARWHSATRPSGWSERTGGEGSGDRVLRPTQCRSQMVADLTADTFGQGSSPSGTTDSGKVAARAWGFGGAPGAVWMRLMRARGRLRRATGKTMTRGNTGDDDDQVRRSAFADLMRDTG